MVSISPPSLAKIINQIITNNIPTKSNILPPETVIESLIQYTKTHKVDTINLSFYPLTTPLLSELSNIRILNLRNTPTPLHKIPFELFQNNPLESLAISTIPTPDKDDITTLCNIIKLNKLQSFTYRNSLTNKLFKQLVDALAINTSIWELDLSYTNIKGKKLKYLTNAFNQSVTLYSLKLIECPIKDYDLLVIGQCSAITVLDISNGNYEDPSNLAVLFDCNNLVSLDISGNSIGDKNMIPITDKLLTNTSITELNLSENFIENEGLEVLAKAIGRLKVLNLGNNEFTDASPLTAVLSTNTVLRDLAIGDNFICDNIGKEFGKILSVNTTLKSLNLESCSLNCMDISDGLRKNNTLTSINVGFNDIDIDGLKIIMDSIRNNYSLTNIGLNGSFYDEYKELARKIKLCAGRNRHNKWMKRTTLAELL